jgi:hypothetical protein
MTYAAAAASVATGVLAVAFHANAQPLPVIPAPPPPPPPPAGAPYVPPVPGNGQFNQPGLGAIGEMWDMANPGDLTNLFPEPAAPYTPVREMPMGPPPPPDPRFFPPPA